MLLSTFWDEAMKAAVRPLPVTVQLLEYDVHCCLSLCLALYPPGAPLGMDKQVSSTGSDFELWDPGIWGVA